MRQRAHQICERLKQEYPDAATALNWSNPLQLLVATILSAQCTDERVNQVTERLFNKYPTAQEYVEAPREELEQDIRSTGLYRRKAKSLQGMAGMIVEQFAGQVPDNIEDMVRLPGVARKTANVVLNETVHSDGTYEGIVVDTHVKRVAYRLGLTNEKNPDKIEQDLMALFAREDWRQIGNSLVLLGRHWCMARKPDHRQCPLNDLCPKRG